jgi:predicted Rossmann fold flavoprotein
LADPVQCDVAILGGGAAGLMCAIEAGRRGRRAVVVEHNREIGRKILISGGGRCNFTNLHARPENFHSSNPHFAKSALARYTPADFIRLVAGQGIAYHEKTLGQLFCDRSARDILRMLEDECRAAGVRILTGCAISEVRQGAGFQVLTGGPEVHAESVVVATGGLSIPKLGATPLGYRLAAQFGLKLIPTRPALVPLVLNSEDRARWCDLAGVSAEATASAGGRRYREKMLITHRGLSGPAVLQASAHWMPGEAFQLDLLPGIDFAAELQSRKAAGERTELRSILAERLPRRLAERWFDVHGPSRPVGQAAVREISRIAQGLHCWSILPAGTEGYEKAEVTAGGVDTDELSSRTMEARRVPGLYFVGEVVDVTGDLGGFNFQWAWASGAAAGRSA